MSAAGQEGPAGRRGLARPEAPPGSVQGLHASWVQVTQMPLCTCKTQVLTWEEAQLKNCVRRRRRARSQEEKFTRSSGGKAANSRESPAVEHGG